MQRGQVLHKLTVLQSIGLVYKVEKRTDGQLYNLNDH